MTSQTVQCGVCFLPQGLLRSGSSTRTRAGGSKVWCCTLSACHTHCGCSPLNTRDNAASSCCLNASLVISGEEEEGCPGNFSSTACPCLSSPNHKLHQESGDGFCRHRTRGEIREWAIRSSQSDVHVSFPPGAHRDIYSCTGMLQPC